MRVIFTRQRRSLGRLTATLLVFFSLFNQPSYAAPIIVNSSIGTGCSTTFATGYNYSNRYVATRDINVSAINILIGTQTISSLSAKRVYIYSDNSVTNSPDVVISTYLPDSTYGSGDTITARFTGSISISSGTKFWVVTSNLASSFPRCYYPSASINQMTFNGVIPDTSTSGSNSSFSRAYNQFATPPNPGSWTSGLSSQIWQLSLEAQPTPVIASLALQNGSTVGTFRATTPLSVSVNVDSKVTYYALGKVIPNCRNIMSSAGVASCNWKPSNTGSVTITARVVPLDLSTADATVVVFQVKIAKRQTFR